MNNELEINGYKIFENYDEAVYVAKSKEDVYDYFVDNYGPTEECQNETKEQFIENLIEIDVASEFAQCIRTYISDDTGEVSESSHYEQYKEVASKDEGTEVIAYWVW
ncbi:hypothetical protein BFR80_013515 [Acinetobacter pittii]|uniref:hypothetical protein n=1 Tax=Acinetobacter pittii TaxID=48296 RepID=UPI0008396FB6|nr:hypothetical protein [Acinetobacter pittii]MCK0925095.1 hypothetical protein [Acinetobacter pittii]OTL85423.1 hypothetical protein B9X62_03845 [Acinetobacter pittii]